MEAHYKLPVWLDEMPEWARTSVNREWYIPLGPWQDTGALT